MANARLLHSTNVLIAFLIELAMPCVWCVPRTMTVTKVVTSNRHAYVIEMGGTMDGVNTRSPLGGLTK